MKRLPLLLLALLLAAPAARAQVYDQRVGPKTLTLTNDELCLGLGHGEATVSFQLVGVTAASATVTFDRADNVAANAVKTAVTATNVSTLVSATTATADGTYRMDVAGATGACAVYTTPGSGSSKVFGVTTVAAMSQKATITGGTGTSQYGSVFNFGQSVTGNAIEAAGSSVITQTSGGGSSAVPIGWLCRSNISGGTFDHAVGCLGWEISTQLGSWRGVEGRVDLNFTGSSGIGLSGLAYLNGGGGGNSGSSVIATSGNCSVESGSATGSTCTGGAFSAVGAAINYNLVAGVGATSGDNGLVLVKGYNTTAARAAIVDFSVSDTLSAFYEDFSDSALSGPFLRLKDTAGVGSWTLAKSDFTTAAQITSAGAETINTMSVTNTGSGYGVVAASNSTKSALSITASAAPSTTNHNGDIYVDSTSKDLKISDGVVYRPVVMGVSVTFSASTTATFTVPSGATLCGCQDTAALLTTGERCTISGTTATATDGTSNSALHICWFF